MNTKKSGTDLFITKMVKKDGKLVYKNSQDDILFKEGVANLREGQLVEMMIDFGRDDGKFTQMAKVNALIGEIAKETGSEHEYIKQQVKLRSGYVKPDGNRKSFSEASYQELSSAIQSAIELGKFLGMSLK